MAITVDATSSGTASVGTTVTVSHTVGAGSNRLLVVMMGFNDATPGFPSSVTFNSVAMTELGGVGSTNNPMVTDGWYLLNPDVGTYDIVVTKDSGVPFAVSAISLFGATTPGDNDAVTGDAATSSSLSLTATKAGMTIDCIVTSLTAPTVNASQTAFGAAANFSGTMDYSSSYKLVSAGTPTMDWTFTLSDYVQGGLFVPEVTTFKPIIASF